jgi:hypothetical protein
LHSFETVFLPIPGRPIAWPGQLLDAPGGDATDPRLLSWITATSAFSLVFLGSRNGGT